MSDFLTSLVARSFGTAPVIRPRVTSLFEPVRGDTAALRNTFDRRDEETIAVQEEEVTAQVSANRRSQAPPRTLSRTDDAPATIPARDGIAMHAPQPHGGPEQSQAPETLLEKHETNILLEPRARAVADDRLTAEETASGEPELRLSKNLPVEVVNVPDVKRQSTKEDKPILLIPPRVAPAMADAERIVRVTDDSSVAGASAQPVRVRAETKDEPGQLIPPKLPAELRMSDLASTARPRTLQREEARVVADTPAAEPTVQVTIGRIEVRASKENAHSSRMPAASPVMPLDEYLRKRTQRVGQ
jgi:hypothetical protein